MAKDIVIFGMSRHMTWPTSNQKNRDYYILTEMLKRPNFNKIVYIDYLPIKRKKAIKVLVDNIKYRSAKYNHSGLVNSAYEKIPGKLWYLSSAQTVISWDKFYGFLRKLLKRMDIAKPIIWSFYPLNVEAFDEIDNSLKIVDIDYDWQYINQYKAGKKIDYLKVLRDNYKIIANKADYIFTASDDLLEIFMGHDNSYWVADIDAASYESADWPKCVDEIINIAGL